MLRYIYFPAIQHITIQWKHALTFTPNLDSYFREADGLVSDGHPRLPYPPQLKEILLTGFSQESLQIHPIRTGMEADLWFSNVFKSARAHGVELSLVPMDSPLSWSSYDRTLM